MHDLGRKSKDDTEIYRQHEGPEVMSQNADNDAQSRERRIERLANALNQLQGGVGTGGPDDETSVALSIPSAPGEVPELIVLPGLNQVVPKCSNQTEGLAMIMASLGISDKKFYAGALQQLINATCEGRIVDNTALNFAVSLVQSVEPRNQLETMLALQMAAVHMASMRFMRKMNHTETIPQLETQERTVNKLMRTFTSQMEALRKHRNGGNQKVVVEHVHVHEGGQAIVGNVTHGGRGGKESGAQFHEQEDLSVSASAAVLSHIETDRMPMPSAGREGKAGMSVSRGKGGSAKR
jgi:hypothetical protein